MKYATKEEPDITTISICIQPFHVIKEEQATASEAK